MQLSYAFWAIFTYHKKSLICIQIGLHSSKKESKKSNIEKSKCGSRNHNFSVLLSTSFAYNKMHLVILSFFVLFQISSFTSFLFVCHFRFVYRIICSNNVFILRWKLNVFVCVCGMWVWRAVNVLFVMWVCKWYMI